MAPIQPASIEDLGRLGRAELESLTASAAFLDRSTLARVLHVEEPTVEEWIEGHGSNPMTAEASVHIGWVHLVLSRLLQHFAPETAAKWIRGKNTHLGGREPLDLLREGKYQDVLSALTQELADGYA